MMKFEGLIKFNIISEELKMEQLNSEVKLVWDGKAIIGEGPSWDHRSGQLIWVEIDGKNVNLFDPQTETNRAIQLDLKIGAAVPTQDGGLILAAEDSFYLLDLNTEKLSQLGDPEKDRPENRFNDGKCDSKGRFWAGSMSRDESLPTGSLYCLETSGSYRKAADNITISNGLDWTQDDKTMYYIDSSSLKVVAYDYSLETGEISNCRTVVTIPDGEGLPDGMAIDAEGMIWVAQWGGWQVSRWNPHTGEKIGSIAVPASQPSACAFGGENYDELYITTARTGLSEEQLLKEPLAGGLFSIKLAVKGNPTKFYG